LTCFSLSNAKQELDQNFIIKAMKSRFASYAGSDLGQVEFLNGF